MGVWVRGGVWGPAARGGGGPSGRLSASRTCPLARSWGPGARGWGGASGRPPRGVPSPSDGVSWTPRAPEWEGVRSAPWDPVRLSLKLDGGSLSHLLCALSVQGCRLQVGADTGVNGYARSSGSACLCDREPTITPIFLLSTLPCRSLLPRSVTKKALRSRNISLPASFSHYHHHLCSFPPTPPPTR